jgi:hypothetical protein
MPTLTPSPPHRRRRRSPISRSAWRSSGPDPLPFGLVRVEDGDSGRLVIGPHLTREVVVFLATHGWWPWLLLYAFLIVAAGLVVRYIVRRRRAC